MAIEFKNEDVFDTLKKLVELKAYKDKYGKDQHYEVEQPLLWHKAKLIVERGIKNDTGDMQLTIPDVSNRRELLVDFLKWANLRHGYNDVNDLLDDYLTNQ